MTIGVTPIEGVAEGHNVEIVRHDPGASQHRHQQDGSKAHDEWMPLMCLVWTGR